MDSSRSPPRLIASRDATPYHAGGTLVEARSDERLLEVLKLHGADFLVLEDAHLEQMSPDIRKGILAVPGVREAAHFGRKGSGVTVFDARR